MYVTTIRKELEKKKEGSKKIPGLSKEQEQCLQDA